MTSLRRYLLLGCLLGWLCPYQSTSAAIMAYSVRTLPFTDVPSGVTVCYLDTALKATQAINEYLQTLPKAEAKAWALAHKTLLENRAFCLLAAKAAGITQLPAVVEDNAKVVYGMMDVHAALLKLQSGDTGLYYHVAHPAQLSPSANTRLEFTGGKPASPGFADGTFNPPARGGQ